MQKRKLTLDKEQLTSFGARLLDDGGVLTTPIVILTTTTVPQSAACTGIENSGLACQETQFCVGTMGCVSGVGNCQGTGGCHTWVAPTATCLTTAPTCELC